jgi:hypothetical protein
MVASRLKHFATSTLITIIFLCSWRAFALHLTPHFNSDHAIHVLMAQDLRLPDDLYYWGQTRLGSLLPILAHALLRIWPIAPITMVAGLQYGLILGGFLGFARLLKHRLAHLTLALVWFLPAGLFLELLQAAHPYAPQFAMIGAACVGTEKLRHRQSLPIGQSSLLVVGAIGALLLSLWVSELSIVLVVLVGRLILQECRFYDGQAPAPWQRLHQQLFWLTVGLGMALIICGKVFATPSYGIFGINTFSQTMTILPSIGSGLWNAATFSIDNFYLSLYTVLAGLVVCGLLLLQRGSSTSFNWSRVFGLNAIVSLGLLINSEWVYRNELSPRYFIVVYLSVWLAGLFWVDRMELSADRTTQYQKPILCLLLITAVIGSCSLPGYVFALAQPQAQLQRMLALRQVAPAGIIGDYWTAYEICAVDPQRLHCTAHDRATVRSQRAVAKVLAAPQIYLVKEGWFETFPAEIQQFGRHLRQVGAAIKLDRYTLAPYKIDRARD